MLQGKVLAVIGAGKMGEALLGGFLEAGVVEASNVVLSDVDVGRLEALRDRFNVEITQSNNEAIARGDIILLAVKPRQMSEVLAEAKESFRENSLVISIVAGAKTEKIVSLAGKDIPVIRVMPNTPALAGKAMSVVSRGAYARDEDVSIALELFSSVGEAVELPEDLQNEATAVSGSGPAYFFLMTEALIKAASDAGIDAEVAKKLVVQTMAGSLALLESTGAEPGELREAVTSPGGTTEAALKVFEEFGFDTMIQGAIGAAIKRAQELA
ncbi:MAG: pyrroline-5-carboxylate reductase [Candidatus Aquicultor sp.]|nr:pyrroline-5-carboxylate reductase [Candidatus Aquicultor sp.]